MSRPDPETEYFDHVAVHTNILLLHKKLRLMIIDKEESKFSDIDLEISAMMHQMSYFSILIQMFYPLEKTYEGMRNNSTNTNTDDVIKAQVLSIDFNNRKSFLVLTAFSLETLLHKIADKYSISLNKRESITCNYLTLMDYFEIEHDEYENLLNIFHYTRNSLHSGTIIKKEWGPLQYKEKIFGVKIGQEYVEHTTWDHFIYFTNEILDIFKKIYASPKFNNN